MASQSSLDPNETVSTFHPPITSPCAIGFAQQHSLPDFSTLSLNNAARESRASLPIDPFENDPMRGDGHDRSRPDFYSLLYPPTNLLLTSRNRRRFPPALNISSGQDNYLNRARHPPRNPASTHQRTPLRRSSAPVPSPTPRGSIGLNTINVSSNLPTNQPTYIGDRNGPAEEILDAEREARMARSMHEIDRRLEYCRRREMHQNKGLINHLLAHPELTTRLPSRIGDPDTRRMIVRARHRWQLEHGVEEQAMNSAAPTNRAGWSVAAVDGGLSRPVVAAKGRGGFLTGDLLTNDDGAGSSTLASRDSRSIGSDEMMGALNGGKEPPPNSPELLARDEEVMGDMNGGKEAPPNSPELLARNEEVMDDLNGGMEVPTNLPMAPPNLPQLHTTQLKNI